MKKLHVLRPTQILLKFCRVAVLSHSTVDQLRQMLRFLLIYLQRPHSSHARRKSRYILDTVQLESSEIDIYSGTRLIGTPRGNAEVPVLSGVLEKICELLQ